MHVLSPDDWRAEWARTDPAKADSLMRFADDVNRINVERAAKWPGVRWSNARYEAHLEQALGRGATVPADYIAAIPTDALRYDWFAFPHLVARRPDLKPAR